VDDPILSGEAEPGKVRLTPSALKNPVHTTTIRSSSVNSPLKGTTQEEFLWKHLMESCRMKSGRAVIYDLMKHSETYPHKLAAKRTG
jgi:hypothetical protein